MIIRDDTIAAIATPIGEGGISVIRLSGQRAIEIADSGFRGKRSLSSVATHTAHFGKLIGLQKNHIDDVVMTVFRQPNSYTGEDVVECSCHGGMHVTRLILDEFICKGARLAQPGEFSMRAFLNGKMDLTQAEAVADLIKARSEAAHLTSIQQLQGRLSGEIRMLREKLLNLLSMIELELDFAEEGFEFVAQTKVRREIETIEAHIESMISSYDVGKVYREGVKVVLCGRPNVGKSSIFNRLLKSNRAIVTDIPGTTRDTLEESIVVNGILFVLKDTAGLRESEDTVEIQGISRAESEIQTADILLFIIDLSHGPHHDDRIQFEKIGAESGRKLLIVENKLDLVNMPGNGESQGKGNYQIVKVSAKTGVGFDELKEKLVTLISGVDGQSSENSIVVTSLRHISGLKDALSRLERARSILKDNVSGEFIAPELRSAREVLGEIIGEVTSDDILNNIFSKFCIGK